MTQTCSRDIRYFGKITLFSLWHDILIFADLIVISRDSLREIEQNSLNLSGRASRFLDFLYCFIHLILISSHYHDVEAFACKFLGHFKTKTIRASSDQSPRALAVSRSQMVSCSHMSAGKPQYMKDQFQHLYDSKEFKHRQYCRQHFYLLV